MSVVEHKQPFERKIQCMVLTVSDTRDKQSDKSGQLMMEKLKESGYQIEEYRIVRDEKTEIESAVLSGCEMERIDAILINGGTGIAPRDITIETLQPLLDKEIVGFGEIFRMVSYLEDIGSAAILSRALAGVIKRTAVISTPGSSGAVRLAMDKLILPELGHIVKEINK
ncbi:MogA/MoaB family molybdenum cofactor biosynthesis protein [Sediminibacillus massiliensis]|uniref:MogA/MoaB family molybdenum cofactor biosynthesis protein n=1 Tax=Sediminibacillus massiliensis TaxID=1926277 RepID=UPI0009884CC8|nr:molybdenum cofactor biosynthesis protein B [Sediminibacillus massiliensis]